MLEAEDFAELTRILREALAPARLASALEGGYDLLGLTESVVAHVEVLRDAP
ncbi:MAG TPA: histone deacetylase family protein, partial [Planctomycetota bacterium]|nr:histone deacetylase family protein [Planctomycetota bacterium]